jgi:SpoVK/Ycf46/Vps4 family AAA+-type ATPase
MVSDSKPPATTVLKDVPSGHFPSGLRYLEHMRELLRLEIQRLRSSGAPAEQDPYRGLYISDEDVDRAIRSADPIREEDNSVGALNRARRGLRDAIEADTGPLRTLVDLLGLSMFEASCLCLCLVSEIDLAVERVIAFAQDDVTKRRPRVDIATRLLADPDDGSRPAQSFHADAPLVRRRLITLHEDSTQPVTPLLGRYLSLDPRITAFLLGHHGLDERLIGSATFFTEPREELRAKVDSAVLDHFMPLASLPATQLPEPLLALVGPDEQLNADVAEIFASEAGLALLEVEISSLVGTFEAAEAVRVADREAALSGALLHIRGITQLAADVRATTERELRAPDRLAALTIMSGNSSSVGLNVELPQPGFEYQRDIWQLELSQHEASLIDEEAAATLAGRFSLSTAGIRQAAVAALSMARSRNPARPAVTLDDLFSAAREQSAPILNDLAQKVTPHYRWEDIVLPADAGDQLREICDQVKHKHLVYDVWGFDKKLAMGKGLVSLFAGESGTGKTMAADVLAGALGIDLYKIDLSAIVSKYIGETEKNLKSIFTEASSSNAILFFDEADALFGKRSEVRDAHDRYANIETAYLLQQIEQYTGVVILATNLKMNLDEAFMRRMHFVVDFPMPDENDRLRIWLATMPPELPRRDDLDFDFLASRFRISGGNIRNIILAAAFLAAGEDTSVGMRHMISATKREFQKLGRIINETELGAYARYLEREPRDAV